MIVTVAGQRLYAGTAGHAFDADKPTVVFIHGVLNDHSVWDRHSRPLADNGWNALAIDLPGHANSAGQPPSTVEAAAAVIVELLDVVGVDRAALVGHSLGSLIALEAAARAPDRVERLALLGTAFPMKVAPSLLEAALKQPDKAIQKVGALSHADAAGTGAALCDASRKLMQRVLASNSDTNLMHAGFKACDDYTGGEKTMAAVQCPVLFILGKQDRMTPLTAGRALASRALDAKMVEVDAGHAMMQDAPDAVLRALQAFLQRT